MLQLVPFGVTVAFGVDTCAPPKQYHPPEQFPVGEVAPTPAQYIPGVHSVQFDAAGRPLEFEKVPAGHGHSVATADPEGQ